MLSPIAALLALTMLQTPATAPAASQPAPAAVSAPADVAAPDSESLHPDQHRRLTMLYLVLSTAAAGLLAFLVLSYMLMRILRRALPRSETKPTVYVDAWSNYRVTQEEIDAATSEPPDPRKPPERDPRDE